MAAPHWDTVKRLFTGALAQPEDQRDAWLADSCRDAELRAEVQQLVASLSRASGFLDTRCVPDLLAAAGSLLPDAGPSRRFTPGDKVGRYEIADLLGAGGMGEVYRARDTRLNRMVVLKVLPADAAARPEWRARLEREARAVSSLSHPHVCALYDIGRHEDADFLVMEYLEGETLAARLARGALPIDDVLTYGSQIADGLGAAHHQGLVHRDVKPSNLMLTAAGAKLLDFGVAKAPIGEDIATPPAPGAATSSLTQHGTLIGTAPYMAPEQIQSGHVDQRTDVFAAGAVLYEMVTGLKAFAAEDRVRVFEGILERDPPPMRQARRGVPRALDRVVARCLAKEPDARYQTAAEVGHDLGLIAASRRRRHRGRWLAVASLALAAGLGLVWRAGQRDQPALPGVARDRIMLAVLPFANQSGDPAQDYLSEGLTDELITELARLYPARLGVIGRASSVRYRQMRKDAVHIERELGVDYFVEGSAARTGPKVQINVRLARASDQRQVWAKRYDPELNHLQIVQADVARSIAREVSLTLTPEQQASLEHRQPVDPDAHEHYLKGRYFWNKRTSEGLKRAVEQFEAAARAHPGYATAYAGIADAYLLLAYYAFLPSDETMARARTAAAKAVALDSGAVEAHVSLGGIHAHDREWADAEREYRQALRLNPNYPTAHQWYANYLIAHGRRAEAQARILRARELDPLSLIIQVNVANVFLLSREYDRAIAECRATLDMDPDFVTARWVFGRAYELKAQYAQAIEEFQRGLAREPENTLLRGALARALALSGARAKADELLRELTRPDQRRYVSPLDLASVYAAMGRLDEAFTLLDRAVDEHVSLLLYIGVDPAYDSLRGDPRFARVLRQLGFG